MHFLAKLTVALPALAGVASAAAIVLLVVLLVPLLLYERLQKRQLEQGR